MNRSTVFLDDSVLCKYQSSHISLSTVGHRGNTLYIYTYVSHHTSIPSSHCQFIVCSPTSRRKVQSTRKGSLVGMMAQLHARCIKRTRNPRSKHYDQRSRSKQKGSIRSRLSGRPTICMPIVGICRMPYRGCEESEETDKCDGIEYTSRGWLKHCGQYATEQ